MGKYEKIVERLASSLNIVGMCFAVAMMLITTLDVALRYVFNAPIQGAFEVGQYLLAGMIWFGMAWLGIVKGHISAELLFDRFSRKTQDVLTVVGHAMEWLFFVLVTWQAAALVVYSAKAGLRTDLLHIPAAVGQSFLVVGASLACVVATFSLYQALRKARKQALDQSDVDAGRERVQKL